MSPSFELFTLAELTALRQLSIRLLAHLALQAKHEGMAHEDYLKLVFEAVSRDVDLVEFPDRSDEEAEMIREIAKARLSVMVTGAGPHQAS